jgi:hypothetical protein
VWASPATDGLLFHNDTVSLCLLVNRRARTMRVFDFRAGVSASKRTFLLSTARREAIERLFIVVEREEVATWTRLGLAKEGTIPGFYKRSDGFLLGAALEPMAPGASGRAAPCLVADLDRAEHTLNRAKTYAKRHIGDAAPMAFKLGDGDEGDARHAVWAAGRSGLSLTAFEPFGRDCLRAYFPGTLRGHAPLWISAEIQPCFDHALLEVLTAPRTEQDWPLYRTALSLAANRLKSREVISMFAFSATDDVLLAAAFVAAGFRRTGVLAQHLWTASGRKDAFLWTRKHPMPGEE